MTAAPRDASRASCRSFRILARRCGRGDAVRRPADAGAPSLDPEVSFAAICSGYTARNQQNNQSPSNRDRTLWNEHVVKCKEGEKEKRRAEWWGHARWVEWVGALVGDSVGCISFPDSLSGRLPHPNTLLPKFTIFCVLILCVFFGGKGFFGIFRWLLVEWGICSLRHIWAPWM